MVSKNQIQLEKAKGLYFAWRFAEAYSIFRRYFDRLPFKPEPEHAEYIGVFVRILFELGKEFELKFYLGELEKLFEKSPDPVVAYSLGVIYSYSDGKKMEKARELFESIVKNPAASKLHPKAKMMLADYYTRRGDIAACRAIVDSIEVDPSDSSMVYLLETWKAVVERREKKYDAARNRLESLLAQLNSETNWYTYFSAKVVLAMVLIDEGRLDSAGDLVKEVRKIFLGRRLKLVEVQLAELEELLKEKNARGPIRLTACPQGHLFTYSNREILIRRRSATERLLCLLVKKRYLDKAIIVKNLYNRQYSASEDDKLVYYHIHCLRKHFKSLGLPPDSIENEGQGYRLVPEVEWVAEEL